MTQQTWIKTKYTKSVRILTVRQYANYEYWIHYYCKNSCCKVTVEDLPLSLGCRREQRGRDAGVSARREPRSSSRDSPTRVPPSIFRQRCTRLSALAPLRPSTVSPRSCKYSETRNIFTNFPLLQAVTPSRQAAQHIFNINYGLTMHKLVCNGQFYIKFFTGTLASDSINTQNFVIQYQVNTF